MATVKEKALIAEITRLALEMGAGEYTACVDYHGYVHGIDVRIAKKNASDWVYYSETCYLSGRIDVWNEKTSLPLLNEMLAQVKAFHPQFDADGVKL
jgi:hypothetical protein